VRIRLSLDVENATDAALYDQCGLPQPGRTMRMGIELG
jgi:outer membrane receptor protein involved in Fe transport